MRVGTTILAGGLGMEGPTARAKRVLSEIGGWLSAFFSSPRALGWAAIAVGILFRVAEYANHRALWKDEELLLSNVSGRPIFEFDRPLQHDQLAPPLFLIVARILTRLFGESSYVLRAVPLAAGIGALFVLRTVARRSISEKAVPLVLALAAVSDDLIYFATEFKQYSTDVLIALGCCLLAWDLEAEALTWRRFAKAAILGVAATWSSHPSAFMLAGAGSWLAARALGDRDWRRVARLAALGAIWGISFALCFLLSSRMLGSSRFMWEWWGFSFLPLPPRSLADVETVFWHVANTFTSPAGIVTPFNPVVTALLSLVLFVLGVVGLAARKRWGVVVVLTAPIALAMIASSLRRYPFHGRVILFLAPSLLLLVAEGVDVVGRRLGRGAMIALAAILLVTATDEDFLKLDRCRYHDFDSHGDHRNDMLDYREARAPRPQTQKPKASASPTATPP